jgi:hypothetical protein
MQTQIQVLDWTVDAAAKIVENDDYIVSMYDSADGDYDVAYIRAKRLQSDTAERAGRAAAMREARVAFTLAMRGR